MQKRENLLDFVHSSSSSFVEMRYILHENKDEIRTTSESDLLQILTSVGRSLFCAKNEDQIEFYKEFVRVLLQMRASELGRCLNIPILSTWIAASENTSNVSWFLKTALRSTLLDVSGFGDMIGLIPALADSNEANVKKLLQILFVCIWQENNPTENEQFTHICAVADGWFNNGGYKHTAMYYMFLLKLFRQKTNDCFANLLLKKLLTSLTYVPFDVMLFIKEFSETNGLAHTKQALDDYSTSFLRTLSRADDFFEFIKFVQTIPGQDEPFLLYTRNATGFLDELCAQATLVATTMIHMAQRNSVVKKIVETISQALNSPAYKKTFNNGLHTPMIVKESTPHMSLEASTVDRVDRPAATNYSRVADRVNYGSSSTAVSYISNGRNSTYKPRESIPSRPSRNTNDSSVIITIPPPVYLPEQVSDSGFWYGDDELSSYERILPRSSRTTNESIVRISTPPPIYIAEQSCFSATSGKCDVKKTKARCIYTREDDKDTFRLEMPCGHAISKEGLTIYCGHLLNNKEYTINCPSDEKCGAKWDYALVRSLIELTPAEFAKFDTAIAENYLNASSNIQRCPDCGTFCKRLNDEDPAVNCPTCSREKGKQFVFCWNCRKQWIGTSYQGICGNSGCNDEERRLALLRNCQNKSINGVICPSIRACPKCGMLITHVEACKHVECTVSSCQHNFCFVCLTPKVNNAYRCGDYMSRCEPASIQTVLPASIVH